MELCDAYGGYRGRNGEAHIADRVPAKSSLGEKAGFPKEEASMSMNGPLARAARALIQWPRSHVAKIAELDEETLARFEAGGSMLAASELTRLRDALERGGAVFIDEDHRAGSGVRLKFNAKDVRAINRMEGEGGPVGTDDV